MSINKPPLKPSIKTKHLPWHIIAPVLLSLAPACLAGYSLFKTSIFEPNLFFTYLFLVLWVIPFLLSIYYLIDNIVLINRNYHNKVVPVKRTIYFMLICNFILAFIFGTFVPNSWTPYALYSSVRPSSSLTSTQTEETTPPPQSPPQDSLPISINGFNIGSNILGENFSWAPQHYVNVANFQISKFEVTNKQYKNCVDLQICKKIIDVNIIPQDSYFGNPIFDDYPVVNVTFEQALTYCKWLGGDLPTEEQWEASARGNRDTAYPWGDKPPTNGEANLDDQVNSPFPSKVGSHEQDISILGVYDVVGNVAEWTNSWYKSYPNSNITFDQTNESKVIRGASYMDDINSNVPRLYYRRAFSPYVTKQYIGFRCVWNP